MAPNSPSGLTGAGGSGREACSLEEPPRFPKLLLTPATERTNCLIVLFSAPSFFTAPRRFRAWGSAAFQGPGRSSNICNTKPPDCTNTPLVRIELFSSCMFFGGAAMINMLGGNHLSISGQKTLHALIRIISAKLPEKTENFQEADGRTRSQQLCRPDGEESNCFYYLLNSIPSPVTDT